MKLVAIGIGGTGAACVEALVHMTMLGLLPEGWELVPVLLDPDQGHPRVVGVTNFIRDYTDLRSDAKATDLNNGGLFGTRIIREQGLNALKPAVYENLYMLLGLGRPDAAPLGSLFFEREEIGHATSHEFANGFYGRANAGVCFFSDPAGKSELLAALREHLRGGASKVVVVGSIFGGTGAAGLLHVARTIRDDADIRADPPPIGVVQLESYFEPDPSNVRAGQEFINLPQTFQRRTGSAYRFLASLAHDKNLPFQILYPLGVRTPSVFPPDWFKRDQQDNPHLYVEYLAALAVRDFVLNGPAPGKSSQQPPEVRVRRVGYPPFGEPLDVLRRLLWSGAFTYQLLTSYVVPLLTNAGGSTAFPGHPWIHDMASASGLRPDQMCQQLIRVADMLRVVLGNAGVLDASWRGVARDEQSEELSERYARMTALTRASFPVGFGPFVERTNLVEALRSADPTRIFEDYARAGSDAQLVSRPLFRWVARHVTPIVPDMQVPQVIDYQLVQQEDIRDVDGQVLNLANIPDDRFVAKAPEQILTTLARATWRSSDPSTARRPSEYPSVWAPAIVYRERLLRDRDDAMRYQHLGLLWTALAMSPERERPPISELQTSSERLAGALRHAIEATCPLANYRDAVNQSGGVLVLHAPDVQAHPDDPLAPTEILGYFFPDTLIVPSVALNDAARGRLFELGRYAERRGLPSVIRERCFDWERTLSESNVADSQKRAGQWQDYLETFGPAEDQPLTPAEMYTTFPFAGASRWIHRLYQAEGRA